jgi:regulator of protease activity HflC (stomatin/prohibitin superfamily)
MELLVPVLIVGVLAALAVALSIVVVPAGTVYVVERLGRYHRTLPQGLHLLAPLVDRVLVRQALREVELPVAAVAAITHDNLVVTLDAMLRVAVIDAEKATYAVADYRTACVQATMSALREAVAKLPFEELRMSRGRLGREVAGLVGRTAAAWGVRVAHCEITRLESGHASGAGPIMPRSFTDGASG